MQSSKRPNLKDILKKTRDYSYECPITLCQSISNDENLSLYLCAIEVGQSSHFILLTTLPISEIPDFKLYPTNKNSDWQNNERLYKIYTEMKELQKHSRTKVDGSTANEIFLELFNEENVKVIPKGKQDFSRSKLNILFKFYVMFFSDIYQIPGEKIATSFFSLTENSAASPKDAFNKRTYLLLPGTSENTIDENMISEFLEYKKKIREMQPDESLANIINVLKGNTSVLENVLTSMVLESHYGNNSKYYFVDMILEPQTQKAEDFVRLVSRYYLKKSYEELLELFGITQQEATEMTVDYLLYEHKGGKVDFVTFFRKIDSKYGVQTDRSASLLFVQSPLTPTTFDFLNINKIVNNYPSCRKPKVILLSLANFPLMSACHLKKHPFPLSHFDTFMKIPSIMIQIERYVIVNEFRGSNKIVSHTQDLFLATCTSSYDSQRNNETLETLGDSVLKLIVSIFLFIKYPAVNESDLTDRRTEYIMNSVLMQIGFAHRVPYFLKSQKKNATEWRPSYMKHDEKVCKHHLTGKQVADCVEAIIGASFLFNYELFAPICLLKQFGLPVYEHIIDSDLIRNSSLTIPPEYFPQDSEFHEDMTYQELNEYFRKKDEIMRRYKCSGAYDRIREMQKKFQWNNSRYSLVLTHSVLAQFENKILQYRFNNKAYLLYALNSTVNQDVPIYFQNYESMEFLGDSILEIYVLANAFKIFREMGRDITPETLQNLKISLLTNTFMARIAVMNEFHRYLITEHQEVLDEVNQFVDKVSFKKKYRTFVKHEFQTPKILSDIFESLAAALLYDGGWKAVHQVYGRLLGPYIKFFCLYLDLMETNIVEKVKEKALEQNEFIDFDISQKEEIYFVELKKKGDYVCEASGPSKQIAKERASYKACKLLGWI